LLVDIINNYRRQYSSKLDITTKNKLKTEITALIVEMGVQTKGKKIDDEKVLKVNALARILNLFVNALDSISSANIYKIDYETIPTPPQSAAIIETPIQIETKLNDFLTLESREYYGEIKNYLSINKNPIKLILDDYIDKIGSLDENKRKVLGLLLKYEHILKKQGGGNSNTEPMKTAKKEILGKERCIYKKAGDRKEYVKHKGNLITVNDYRKLMKR
jgi:hypothetical protein